jgi:UDP-N-acetyl-D-mannosaminuronic acid dehydrogenase
MNALKNQEESMRIAVVGMGYVGIPVAALLADVKGFDVTGIQRRSKRSGWKIDLLNTGKSPFDGDEPGLPQLLSRVVEKGTFRVTEDYTAVSGMDAILIDVQTPTDGPDHQPSYLSLKQVCKEIGSHMKKGTLIITESTVAPGTTQHVIQPILERKSGMKAGIDFSLAYSYERVMPGRLLDYIVNLPRIVGGVNGESERKASELYRTIVRREILTTDVLTAETSKVIENAYRDVNIAFANEMALVCERLGIDAFEVRGLVNSREERHMHLPGSGVGGHCLPKDTWLLRYGLQRYGNSHMETEFINLARRINNYMPTHMAKIVESALNEQGRPLRESRIGVLGIAYLEDSDDTRNTPAQAFVRDLEAMGAEVVAHDPYVREFEEIELTRDLDAVLKGSDCMAIVTKHRPYFDIDLDRARKFMRTPIIVDGRNVIDRATAESLGFIYRGVGKGSYQNGLLHKKGKEVMI